jgi:hypothetical protein
MATVSEDYLGTRISWKNFVAIQKAVGWLVDGLPEEGFFTRWLVDTYWTRGNLLLAGRVGAYPDSLGGFQAQNGGPGCPGYL